jgi:hypothetical protein
MQEPLHQSQSFFLLFPNIAFLFTVFVLLYTTNDPNKNLHSIQSLANNRHNITNLQLRLLCWNNASQYGGKWVLGSPIYNTTFGLYGMEKYRIYPSPSTNWQWKPAKHCGESNVPFSRVNVCKRIGHSILFVGDSLNEQIYLSFANALASGPHELNHSFIHASNGNITVCGGSLHLFFVRNDRLSLVDAISVNLENNMFEYPWAPDLQNRASSLKQPSHFDFVFLNRGAHYEEDSIVLNAVDAAVSYIKRTAPSTKIIWRTSMRGHLNPDQFFDAPPLSEEIEFKELEKLPYNWGKILTQNAKVLNFLKNKFSDTLILDVAPAMGLRHDRHARGDGLHWKMPGPIDHVLETFAHFLIEIDQVF